MLRVFIVWVAVLLLVGTVAACPIMNCPMMQAPSDDCCSGGTTHPARCPQHQNSNDCPYQVVEKAIASKIFSSTVGAVVVESCIQPLGLLMQARSAAPSFVFSPKGSRRHLLLCTLLI